MLPCGTTETTPRYQEDLALPLQPGQRIAHYRVVEKIGEGGMGEVYRAEDTRLGRSVAIKVLPEAFVQDSTCLARLSREAQILASLNHPNIATIHGLEEADGTTALALELVEGETLAERIARGPMSLEETVRIALQIAEALEAAHEKGIIHRDLKPGNVKFSADGRVKVLDFGLAKAVEKTGSPGDMTRSPTVSVQVTQNGGILGTAAYMSPEQAAGHPIDHRSDIWSFGVVVAEMLTGQRPFRGESVSHVLASVLKDEPDLERLRTDSPPGLLRLLNRCLRKDPKRRLQSIGDARLELDDLLAGPEGLGDSGLSSPRSASLYRWLPWTLSAALAVALLWVGWSVREREPPYSFQGSFRSSVALPSNLELRWRGTNDTWGKIGYSRLLALSPDGSRIVLTAADKQGNTGLYLKGKMDFELLPIAGADGARGATFSPDGLWVAFLTENVLKKVRLPGGPAQSLGEIGSAAFDGTWLQNGSIVYSTDTGLWQISDQGGEPQRLTSIDIDRGIRGHHFPNAVPGQPLIIFTLTTESGRHAALLSLETGEVTTIKQNASDARSVANRFLVFARGGELFASSYDPENPFTVGVETPLASGVHTEPGQSGALVHAFATSQTGLLAFAPAARRPAPDSLVWVDQRGREELIVEGPGYWMHQRLSPDGRRILFNRLMSSGMLDLYIHDIKNGVTDQLTRQGHAYDAEWSPDGTRIGFAALDPSGRAIYTIPSDFSGSDTKILGGSESRPHFSQWAPGGDTLVFFDRSSKGGIWTSRADGRGGLAELINTPLGEAWARISPDGRLLTYVGFESGRRNVYVQEYPALGSRLKVSRNGGGEPRWGPDSRTLYFREAGKIFKTIIRYGSDLEVDVPVVLPFDDEYESAASGHQHYDLSSDGARFLMIKHGERFHPRVVYLIQDWSADSGLHTGD